METMSKYSYFLEVVYPDGTKDAFSIGDQNASHLANLLKGANPELEVFAWRHIVTDIDNVIEEVATELSIIKNKMVKENNKDD